MSKNTYAKSRLLAGITAFAILVVPATGALAVVRSLSGLVHESIYVRTSNTPTTVIEGALQTVANTSVGGFVVAPGDTDLFTVLFTSEAELRNASTTDSAFSGDDVIELQAEVISNNTGSVFVLNPVGPTTFAGGGDQGSHAASWAFRLGTDSWTFRIRGRVLDRAPAPAAVIGELDKWTLTIARYN